MNENADSNTVKTSTVKVNTVKPGNAKRSPLNSAALSQQVGIRLRFIRHKQGLSQRELARRADITNGALSNIEQGKVSPSIVSLEKILGAIPMSLQEFFSEEIDTPPPVYSKDQFVQIQKNQTRYEILPFEDSGREGSYIAKMVYEPGAKVSSEWMVNSGYIAGIVLEGALDLILEGHEYHLTEGDGFHFAHQRGHSFNNVGSSSCTVVAVSLLD
ncbi:MAG: transcriptional regulator with XRE-family HTH domain [Flavobacteriales bacterium]|jgi:transcriptional regulator with XRE-family HTH domain